MLETKKVSLQQEDRVAKIFCGTRTPQSGGGKWVKGDVISEHFLVECKTTVTPKNSYSISRHILNKADAQRRDMGKPFYALAFTFGDNEDFFVVDSKTMTTLIHALNRD